MASVYEIYGTTTSSSLPLYWTRSEPVLAPGQKVPFVIGLHPGGYKAGSAVLNNIRDKIVQAGMIFCGTEYRLAPGSKDMNTRFADIDLGFIPGNHVSPGQDTVNDHGYAGSPELDVAMAVRAARADPKCDGRVYGVGGSAGASLVIYNMLTGTEGDDKFDLGVSCSIGVFDFYQSEIWFIPNPGDETYPAGALANRLNIPDTNPLPPTGADLATAKVYSPSFLFNSSKIAGRHWMLISNRDSAGIPTSSGVDIPSYQKLGGGIQVNEGTPPYTTNTGFIKVCIAAGMTESTADVPESGNFYKKTIVDVANAAQPNPLQHAHAFNYWPSAIDPTTDPLWTVGDAVSTWLAAGPAGTIGERPVITSFEPTEGFAGVTAVVITGDNFNGTQGVRFNHVDALSFVVDSNTQITAIPPIGATTGVITVRTPVDTVNSTTDFVVTTQTIVGDDALEARQPILSYPRGGLAPVPPMPPAAPTAVEAHASGVAGSHSGQATWIPPTDTSGATLLNYIGYLTSETGASGTVPDIPGSASSVVLSDLELETEYTFHIASKTIFGTSGEIAVTFTSNPSDAQTVKDQPRGCLFLFDSPIDRVTGKHVTDWNPSGFWGNPRLYGSRYRSSWDTICTNPLDPTDDTYYDWSDVDAYIDKCELYGQFAGISFAAGIYCPPWIYANPRIKTIDEQGPDPGTMPIPWNEAYLDKWISFIKAFADRYDNRDGLIYFVVGGLGQVVETILAQNENDLIALRDDAVLRGFGTIEEAWMFAANRILFACGQAFKHTHFLVSLARIVPNSGGTWGPGDQGDLSCEDVFSAGRTIAPNNFGVMNAGLNENSNASGGFAPNVIIHDNSAAVSCGFQFGHSSNSDVTVFGDTCVNGSAELFGKFLELYKNDARALTTGYPSGGDPAYEAIIDTANNQMINVNP